MSQRNVMNERNTEPGKKPAGVTRKSAASAKPKTKAASSVYVPKNGGNKPKKKGFMERMFNRNHTDETPKERKAREAAEARKDAEKQLKKEIRAFKPDTPEYRKWKMVFWGCLVISLLIMLPVTLWTDLLETNYAMYATMLLLAWGFLTAAIITDIQKVKPAREEAYYKQAAVRNKANKNKKKK